jgi:RNA polymerase sigma-70 factor (ECF subfamily)
MPFSAPDLLAELPRLRRYARILTDDPEHADRLVEETLFRFRERRVDSGSDATRRTQLLALLRSVSADHTAPSARREAAAPFAVRSPPDRGTEMLAQLRALPLEQREVLVLVAVEQMSYADIAALLHLPVATVISRLSQAREVLRSSPPKPVSAPNSAT